MSGYTWANMVLDWDIHVKVKYSQFCEDIVNSLDEGARIDVIIIDFSKAFDSFPHD